MRKILDRLLGYNYLPLISKYRSELMGIGIINVLLYHFLCMGGFSNSIVKSILDEFNKLVFTEGFLFLSGFGLYYSFSKDSHLKIFYKKRTLRVYLPYVLITLPFFFYFDLITESNAIKFLGDITTLSFWKYGNFYGMWYIAMTLLLYAIFPLLYKFSIQANLNRTIVRLGILMCLSLLIPIVLKLFAPDYYKLIKIGIDRPFIFLCGIAYGYASKCNDLSESFIRKFNFGIIFVCVLIFVMSCFVDQLYNLVQMMGKLISIPLLCILIDRYMGRRCRKILNWGGSYTLELYVLHLFLYSFQKCVFPNVPALWLMSISIILSIFLCKPVHVLISKIKL